MIKQKIRDSIISGVSTLAIVLVAIVSLLLQNNVERQVSHSVDTKIHILEVHGLLQDYESGVRGYLITNDTSFLSPFNEVKQKMATRLESLHEMTADDPRQQALLIRFRAHSMAKLEFMGKVFRVQFAGQHDQAAELISSNVGESLMLKVEELKDEMMVEEDRLLYGKRYDNIMLQRISLIFLTVATLLAAYSLYRLYKKIGPLITNLDLANENLHTTIDEKNQELELRKQAEQKNAQLIDILTAKNAELNHFAYIASHDLQEPLRTVNSFIEVFKEDYGEKLGGDAHQYFEFMLGATRRMKSLIEGLLNYSRLGKSRGAEEVDLNEVLTAVKENLAATIEFKHAAVEVVPLPTLKCMKTETTQLFQNLINNAIKYTAAGVAPKVTISAEEKGNAWEFCVADNGIGIPQAQQGKIFSMFSRLHGDGEYEGQGIGLAFCKKIIELHGGRIWVTSELGQGSTFYFTISKKMKNEAEIEQNIAG